MPGQGACRFAQHIPANPPTPVFPNHWVFISATVEWAECIESHHRPALFLVGFADQAALDARRPIVAFPVCWEVISHPILVILAGSAIGECLPFLHESRL